MSCQRKIGALDASATFRRLKVSYLRTGLGQGPWPDRYLRHEENKMIKTVLRTLLLGACLAPTPLAAQETPRQQEDFLRMFLDCPTFFCDMDFFRRQIGFVDYVRDRRDADVHVLVTSQRTGGGGREFEISFIGIGDYEGTEANLRYTSGSTDTQDETRHGLARIIRFGLMEFVAASPVANRIEITFRPAVVGQRATTQPTDDPWNFWAFRIQGSGSVNGEKTSQSYRISGSLNADRVTEDWKLNLRVNGSYSRSEFELSEETTFVNTSKSYGANGLLVRSITNHWSIGARMSASSSTFLNTDLRFRLAPAVEYNVFPYPESSRRQLTFQYAAGVNAVDYEEETIFDKTSETLLEHSLTSSLGFIQPWGSSTISLRGSQFLSDLSKNQISLFGITNVRLFRGLSFNFFGSVSRVRDQLFLPKGGASDEEILLRRRQLATSYTYRLSGGFTYRFGSIFNNVVNPRFGGGGRTFIFF